MPSIGVVSLALIVTVLSDASLRDQDTTAIRLMTASSPIGEIVSSCLIPRFDGAILSREWKEARWDRFVTGAPRPSTPSEQH
jgi:hypothetical protein